MDEVNGFPASPQTMPKYPRTPAENTTISGFVFVCMKISVQIAVNR